MCVCVKDIHISKLVSIASRKVYYEIFLHLKLINFDDNIMATYNSGTLLFPFVSRPPVPGSDGHGISVDASQQHIYF